MTNQAQTEENAAAPEWRRSGGLSGNSILAGDGFFISYMPPGGLSGLAMFASDGNGDETALCRDGKYLILNGDYRSAYEGLVPEGFDACKRFYDQQSAHADSSWTQR